MTPEDQSAARAFIRSVFNEVEVRRKHCPVVGIDLFSWEIRLRKALELLEKETGR